MADIFEATVFYDDAGEASARLFAVFGATIDDHPLSAEEWAACQLDLRVEGPACRYSSTLKTRIRLKHRGQTKWGDRAAVFAEAFLPDPCPWTPELPFLYRVAGEARLDGRTIAEVDQTFGIRPLSAVGRRFVFQGKTWVPRAVLRELVYPVEPLERWREAAAAMYVVEPSAELCRGASEVGVMIVAQVPHGGGMEAAEALCRLSRYPAVVMAIVDTDPPLDSALRSAAKNTLLVCDDARDGATSGADGLIGSDMPEAEMWRSKIPVVAHRSISPDRVGEWCNKMDLERARAQCDRLQADLAGKCAPAGYIVGHLS